MIGTQKISAPNHHSPEAGIQRPAMSGLVREKQNPAPGPPATKLCPRGMYGGVTAAPVSGLQQTACPRLIGGNARKYSEMIGTQKISAPNHHSRKVGIQRPAMSVIPAKNRNQTLARNRKHPTVIPVQSGIQAPGTPAWNLRALDLIGGNAWKCSENQQFLPSTVILWAYCISGGDRALLSNGSGAGAARIA